MASVSEFLRDILSPDGAVARRLGDGFEHRPQQLEMATAVADALSAERHLVVEAGTGVGKSFAYLLPVIDHAVRNNQRVVISTHTISLQEQLIDKDIPLLQSVYPDEFTAVLVKGRNNYLCQRKLGKAGARQQVLFDSEAQLDDLQMIQDWATHTTDGSLSDLPKQPAASVWERVCAEHGNCLGRKCPFFDRCHWQAAKRRMTSGRILIVNHALFFSDLALRMAGVNYLPKYEVVVLDEAHTVEDVAANHFGLSVSDASIRYQLRHLWDARRGKGVLNTHGTAAHSAIETLELLDSRLDGFFQRCDAYRERASTSNGRIREREIVDDDVTPEMAKLAKHLRAMLPALEDDGEILELQSAAEKLTASSMSLRAILGQEIEDAVYWIDGGGGRQKRISLHCSPINIGSGLRKHLFEKVKSVVLTSATLCTESERSRRRRAAPAESALPTEVARPAEAAQASEAAPSGEAGSSIDPSGDVVPESAEPQLDTSDAQFDASDAQVAAAPVQQAQQAKPQPAPEPNKHDPFDYIRSRLGVIKEDTLKLGSPFDYESQATLFVEAGLPDPGDSLRFLPLACERILHYVDMTNGGAFVLFTSYSMLKQAEQRIGAEIEARGMRVLSQASGAARRVLLEQFRQQENCVLFGTSSFWQGIDVRGEALRNVIITRLPFAVPDDPVVEGRLDAITRSGGNAFMEYQVPEAIIRLKQGFGRLIRSRADKGIVVILDSRVVTRRYGRLFLESLPDCRRVVNR